MAPNLQLMAAIEALNYRATVGDVATQSGLDLQTTERELLDLASGSGAHLQVSAAGEIAFVFPRAFRAILRQKSVALRLRALWQKIWPVLFTAIRFSFGILLLVSIALIYLTLFAIVISGSSDRKGKSSRRPDINFRIGPIWPLFFDFGSGFSARRAQSRDSSLNFLEAVYSFLFGDGNPNADLEERRWQLIAGTIRARGGAVIAEQIAPYLDALGTGDDLDREDCMLPVLVRFNGFPKVSPEGEIIYHFPELQVTAAAERTRVLPPPFLQASLLAFSAAPPGKITLAVVLGAVNLVGIAMLGFLLQDAELAAQLGSAYGLVGSLYWVFAGYGIAFLGIPLIRYFWIQGRNRTVAAANQARQHRALLLEKSENATLRHKLAYAQQFAERVAIDPDEILYSGDRDLSAQELDRAEEAGRDWERRLGIATSHGDSEDPNATEVKN